MKNYNIEISDFSKGEVSQHIIMKNQTHNLANSSYKLLNMIVDNNKNIVRRPGTNNITSLDSTPVKMFSFELENKSIILNFYDHLLEIYVFVNLEEFNKQTLSTYFDGSSLSKSLSIVYSSEKQEFYIFSENCHPAILKFDKEFEATINELYFIDGPYLNEYGQGVSLDISYLNYEKKIIKIKASKNIFVFHDKARCIKIKQGQTWGSARIRRVLDSNLVEAEIITPLVEGNNNIFKLSVFAKSVGFPKQALLFENRLYLIGGFAHSSSVYISKYGKLLDFSDTEILRDKNTNISIDSVLYDSAICFNIANSYNNNWLATSKNSVLVGSEKGVYAILRQDPNQSLSPYNIIVKQVSSNDCSNLCIYSDIGIIFTDCSKKNIYITDISQETMIGILKINTSAVHLFKYKIKRIYLTKEPFYILWVILEDGTLLSASIIEGNFAWSSHDLFGNIQDITSSYMYDDFYLLLIVNRESTVTSLEYLYLNEIYNCYLQKNSYLDCKSKAYIKNGILQVNEIYNKQKIIVLNTHSREEFNDVFINNGEACLSNYALSSDEVLVGYSYLSIYKSPCINLPEIQFSLHLDKSIKSIILNTINSTNISISNSDESNIISNLTVDKLNNYSNNSGFIIVHPFWNISKNEQIVISQKSSNNLCICGLTIYINM